MTFTFAEIGIIHTAGHKNTVSSLAFSSDGQLLASGGLDASVKIWDTSGNLKSTFGSPMEESEFEVNY